MEGSSETLTIALLLSCKVVSLFSCLDWSLSLVKMKKWFSELHGTRGCFIQISQEIHEASSTKLWVKTDLEWSVPDQGH